MNSLSRPGASGNGGGSGPPRSAWRGDPQAAAAVAGALIGVLAAEPVARLLPLDRWSPWQFGFAALVAAQVAWSWWRRSRGRATALLVFCEAAAGICLGRLLADALNSLH